MLQTTELKNLAKKRLLQLVCGNGQKPVLNHEKSQLEAKRLRMLGPKIMREIGTVPIRFVG
ncbi:hypothetical protein SAMN02746041_03169 [Desulfacinum hydrothermale DSM 13146]|uniref:Uncharacterized protein n=1 Tax=Desulfacinum hydrothermale DSM 13146 TaxID=1121390 RepID=A0A1W1XVX5_9BACT|nr:hypothetical protein [Desulfacinum hydrothermale]SMC28076.1 hypothetical protein SAMN02746041_03169 [Desulfacinum hydrothermale DSM 13146]